jgi:predicted membrane protein (TIGR00267 family)
MIQEEIGVSPEFIDNPYEIAFISAGSFIIGAIPAIIPFFLFDTVHTALIVSASVVLAFLFVVGIFKTKITKVRWLKSGLETLLIGAISCGAGFFLGRIVAGYFYNM